MLVTAYSLFRWGSGREMLLGLGLMMVPATTALVFDYTGPAEAIGGFAVFFAVLGIGTAVRYRTGERLRRLEEVRLHEREQFARDLHDTVAHHVSAIAIRAQAGLAVVGGPTGGGGGRAAGDRGRGLASARGDARDGAPPAP